ncbi:MAG: ACP S-malonyltransferase [Planctomycetota bacterium]|nr:MAG: ACP S-malonyltransferase [Planctomycetota bacterium]
MNAWRNAGITDAALAFRGYNITNLGRTAEFLAVSAYRDLLIEELGRYGDICADTIGQPVDLLQAVRSRLEFDLDRYAEAIALVVAVEMAQLRMLREVHGVDYGGAKLAFGYSLGEMVAACAGGAFAPEDLVRVPLAMAKDCAELARDVQMGVLFSRDAAIPEAEVRRLCVQVTREGAGTIGVSAILSPNTYLLVGQNSSVEHFRALVRHQRPTAQVRCNPHRWPPLHTPIVRQRNVPDRAAVMMEALKPGRFPPRPPVISLVTGKRSYDEHSARETLRQWIDHPQRLWDAVCETLAEGVKFVLHIGPAPNVIPATFTRLAENVRQQTAGRSFDAYRKKAISGIVQRQWLAALLPARASLLRAPYVQQVIVEDWLLDNAPR